MVYAMCFCTLCIGGNDSCRELFLYIVLYICKLLILCLLNPKM